MGELVDDWGDLEALHQDALLPLDANVLRPLHEAGQVFLRQHIASHAEVLRLVQEQGILDLLALLGRGRGCNNLLALRYFLWLPESL